jgi:hypothetical protein
LILLEYHYAEDRDSIKELLKADFLLDYEYNGEWSAFLPHSLYRKDLEGNYYGKLYFVNKQLTKLKRNPVDNHGSLEPAYGLSSVTQTDSSNMLKEADLSSLGWAFTVVTHGGKVFHRLLACLTRSMRSIFDYIIYNRP